MNQKRDIYELFSWDVDLHTCVCQTVSHHQKKKDNCRLMELQTNEVLSAPTHVKPVRDRSNKGTGGSKGAKECRIEPVRFKTRMCKHWERTGHCPYAPKCAFAHGPEDMRSIEINASNGITRLSRLKALQTRMAREQYPQVGTTCDLQCSDPHDSLYTCMACLVPPPPPPPPCLGSYAPCKYPSTISYVHDPYSTSTPYRLHYSSLKEVSTQSSCSSQSDAGDGMSGSLETVSN